MIAPNLWQNRRQQFRPPASPNAANGVKLTIEAPTGDVLTEYDWDHAVTYIRMLDAQKEGADWREGSRIVLHIEADRELQRARRASIRSWLARSELADLVRLGLSSARLYELR